MDDSPSKHDKNASFVEWINFQSWILIPASILVLMPGHSSGNPPSHHLSIGNPLLLLTLYAISGFVESMLANRAIKMTLKQRRSCVTLKTLQFVAVAGILLYLRFGTDIVG